MLLLAKRIRAMGSKTGQKFFLLISISFLLANCNKPEVYIDSKEQKCQEGLIQTPKTKVTGSFYYDEPLTITISVDQQANNPISDAIPYLQFPNGSEAQLTTFKIESLEPKDEGTYYAYYKNAYCSSPRVSFNIEGKTLVPPCSYQDNWLGGSGFPSGVISKTTKTVNQSGRLEFAFFGTDPAEPIITLQINSSTIVEGFYYLQSVTRNLGSISQGKKAYVEHVTQGSPKKYLVNTTGGKLYILKTAPKKYDFIICNEVLSNGGLSPFYELQLRATIEE